MIPYWVGIIWIILAGMTGITVGLLWRSRRTT